MKLLERFKGKFYRRILKTTGLCTACFIFEACYGAPEGEYEPIANKSIDFSGWVKDDSTRLGIENISIKLENLSSGQSIKTFSDRNGMYNLSLQAFSNDELAISFIDADSTVNNLYEDKDSIFSINDNEYSKSRKEINIFLKEQ